LVGLSCLWKFETAIHQSSAHCWCFHQQDWVKNPQPITDFICDVFGHTSSFQLLASTSILPLFVCPATFAYKPTMSFSTTDYLPDAGGKL